MRLPNEIMKICQLGRVYAHVRSMQPAMAASFSDVSLVYMTMSKREMRKRQKMTCFLFFSTSLRL
jgi:hypothetical protein